MKISDIFISYSVLVLLSCTVSAQNSSECYPPCRAGFTCHNGSCISLCNPPCPDGQNCNDKGECIVSESTEQPLRQDIPCNAVFIVKPYLGPNVIAGNYEPSELISAETMLIKALAAHLPSPPEAIAKKELESVKNCNAQLITVKVESYYKEPARLGQFVGVISIIIETYDSIQQEKPTRTETFSARGELHWGDSVPFENAIISVSKKIKSKFRLQ